MVDLNTMPRIICLAGVDGCGKTTLAHWLCEYLISEGINTKVVWSRFNNYLSKPMLAITRLTGHNYRKTIDGEKFGFHDFDGLPIYNRVFALCQAVDVNIATYFKIKRPLKTADVIVCERGPWDTLVDVMADTGMKRLGSSLVGRLYTAQVRENAAVICISRSHENIVGSRSELLLDHKMKRKIDLYSKLAKDKHWHLIDNNRSLDDAKQDMLRVLGLD